MLLRYSWTNACIYKPVSVTYNKETDFKNFKTFAWIPESDTIQKTYKNDLVKNITMNYINHCMMLRGYKVDTLNPDLLLDLKLLDEKKKIISPYVTGYPFDGIVGYSYPYFGYYYYPYPYHYTYGGWYTPYWNTGTYTTTYTERTINLNIIDRKNKQAVWSGTTVGDIYDPKFLNKFIHPGIHRMLKKYPVKPVVRRIKYLYKI